MKRAATLAIIGAIALAFLADSASSDSRQLRVALVLDDTQVGRAYERLPIEGLQRAVKELGVQAKVVAKPPSGGYLPSFASLARQKYDLIISLGGNQSSDLDTAARQFPDQRFAILDTPLSFLKHRPRNVLGSAWQVQNPAYLAGYLAGLMEKRRPGKDVVGSVGGFSFPPVNAYIAGFEAGARKADPGIKTLRGYSGEFNADSKCKTIALSQIAAGAGVVFNVAGACGLGALRVAKEKHVWGVGIDVDQSFLGSFILTSVVKRWDVDLYDTVEALVQGKLRTGRDRVWDLSNGAVGLGRTSPKVPKSFVRQIDGIRRQIIAGKITVPTSLG